MKITREETTEWDYPCFGRAKDGEVVWFTEYGIGVVVRGSTSFNDGWNMDCFTPIDNPFEKEKKFKPITIVLETEEELKAMKKAMMEESTVTNIDWNKLIALIG
jgi:hypothetical protein